MPVPKTEQGPFAGISEQQRHDWGVTWGDCDRRADELHRLAVSESGKDDYREFLLSKSQLGNNGGFKPLYFSPKMFDFQRSLAEWTIAKGRSAVFADCGLGKTIIELVWAENVVRHTNRPVLYLTPLAVSAQTIQEAEKFGIEAQRSRDGQFKSPGIIVTNYEQLHRFDTNDFAGVVCDESSLLKNFQGKRKSEITEFMRTMPYRLLATATAAPNDYIELGTSSEALGGLGYLDMLGRFFKNDQNTIQPMRKHIMGKNYQDPPPHQEKWRFKGHAEIPFYRFVCSWARAGRKPSDFGPFDDSRFVLPELIERQHIVEAMTLPDGMMLPIPAISLEEQREERRRTIRERCEKVAELCEGHDSSLIWCHLNDEGDLIEKVVPNCVQISGKDSDEAKEEKFLAFIRGEIKNLATKHKIGAWGLNMQHCAHMVSFPSHSFEQYYQGVRRCWRFGQTRPVVSDIVTTEGEQVVLENLQRKARACDQMFSRLVEQMHQAEHIQRGKEFTEMEEIPRWL
jgi:hypothetical protein